MWMSTPARSDKVVRAAVGGPLHAAHLKVTREAKETAVTVSIVAMDTIVVKNRTFAPSLCATSTRDAQLITSTEHVALAVAAKKADRPAT